jgi:2-hydroxychromene-2-carboxylate isomerase
MDKPSTRVVDAFIDLRSPYSYLAIGPARALARQRGAHVNWWPFITDFRAAYGGEVEQRSARDVAKVKYLYMDCRRLAELQGLVIRSTTKLWDASLGSQAFLLAKSKNRLWEFLEPMLAAFWRREFDLESPESLQTALAAAGIAASEWRSYLTDRGEPELQAALSHGDRMGVFGAPTFVCDGELFWGGDRLNMLDDKLRQLPI